jgi:hypothetical protein
VTEQTNLFLVHERAAEDKAKDLPTLQHIAQMQAAGWAGHSTVLYQSMKTEVLALQCHSSPPDMLFENVRASAVWRRESATETIRAMERNGTETYDIPRFLRRQSDGDESPILMTPNELLKSFSESGKIKTWIYGVSRNIEENSLPLSTIHLINELEMIFQSREQAWSLYIYWLAQNFQYPLPRHAERAVRKGMSGMIEAQKDAGMKIIEADFAAINTEIMEVNTVNL